MDFPAWWNRSAFLQKYADRKMDTGNLMYVDYAMLLTVWEAMVWDKNCLDAITQSKTSVPDAMLEKMKMLEERLNTSIWVIVESYEWESGFD
jgi:hypothetical protein